MSVSVSERLAKRGEAAVTRRYGEAATLPLKASLVRSRRGSELSQSLTELVQ